MYGIDLGSWRRGVRWDADRGADAGNPPENKPGSNSPTADVAGAGNQPNDGGGEQQPETIMLTAAQLQERIDAAIKERLEREKRKSERDAQRAREDAEAEALARGQEWQKLAEKHAARITELEQQGAQMDALVQERDRYKAALEGHLKTQRDGLPAHILTLLDQLDPAAQLEYIAANAAVLRSGAPAQEEKKTVVPASPKPGDGKALTGDEAEAARARQWSWTRSIF